MGLDQRADLSCDMWRRLNELVLLVNGSRSLGDIQREVVAWLGEAVPHRMSFFDLCCTDADGHIEYFDPVSTTMDPASLDAYYQTYAMQDYTTWSFNAEEPIVYRDLDIVDARVRDSTPIYRNWMEPLGLYYGMGCTIVQSGVLYGSITLFRERERGDFADEELALLAELDRHLAVRFSDLCPQGIERAAEGDRVDAVARRCGLAPREAEVMRLMVEGSTNAQMARGLFISESTVKKHVNAVYRKCGVKNRMQLAQLVYGTGAR